MNEAENKREYEISFLLTPDIAEDKLDFEAEEIKKFIAGNGGKDVQLNSLKNKRLAYPVKKQNQAYLGIVYFNIDPGKLDDIKRALNLNAKILRFLILNDENKPARSAILTPTTLPSEEKTTEIPNESFDKKLESILTR